MSNPSNDSRVVMTLDAGGTNFVFSAMRANQPVVESFSLPSRADDLELSLNTLVEGFKRVQAAAPAPPVAISFAFPAPADYFNGIIVGPRNLPAYKNVALGPMLEDTFSLPTFINNDGDLFAYGEATSGFLPYVNGLLEQAGSPKRFRNLLGVTLGTGFGGGIVRDGQLFTGDNSVAGEVWLLRHKLERDTNAEEGAAIRAVRRVYAERSGIGFAEAPEPKVIYEIAEGTVEGNREAAQAAFRRMGEVAGDAISEAITLMDALVVVGGGIAGAHRQFLPAIVDEMNGTYLSPQGERFRRLIPRAFNLEDEAQRAEFLRGETKELSVPHSKRTVRFDGLQRTGVGLSRLGTSQATAIGAYSFALSRL
ncbi:ROK family protein [Paludibaculum fermentans]|uniref:ROK family protein n=1 Tax=Paludibaculum fermentans TaxID=1473598 RepID=UPI003EB9DEEC